jgi:uncharacterized DUF497 family protein
MEFVWDEKKNRLNIKKHGLDLADAGEVFNKVLLAFPDNSDYSV